jgi:hypothetical protein
MVRVEPCGTQNLSMYDFFCKHLLEWFCFDRMNLFLVFATAACIRDKHHPCRLEKLRTSLRDGRKSQRRYPIHSKTSVECEDSESHLIKESVCTYFGDEVSSLSGKFTSCHNSKVNIYPESLLCSLLFRKT